MPYPFILATNGQELARVNFDVTWSVRWEPVFDSAYAKPHPLHTAVQAYARLLVAAKDNFILTSWVESDRQRDAWDHYENIIDYVEFETSPGTLQSSISMNGLLIARVNYDGSWSVRWDDIHDLAVMPDFNYHGIALIGICRLFMAAKDRFLVTPWTDHTEEEWD